MTQITVSTITTTAVKTQLTDYIYNQLMYDGSGAQTADQVCQNAINTAFQILQSKTEKAGFDLLDLDVLQADGLTTVFLYFAISEAYKNNLNWGSYGKYRKSALTMMSDILGLVVSDAETDGSNSSSSDNKSSFMAANVQALTYTTKEAKLFDNNLWN